MNDVEDALQRFGELEQRELLTGVAQVASDTSVLKDGVYLFRWPHGSSRTSLGQTPRKQKPT